MALVDRHPRLFRMIALATATAVLTSATASGLHSMSVSVGTALEQYLRPHGPYTQAPTKPYLGKHPGKDKGRGGVWSVQARQDAEGSANPIQASLEPAPMLGHTLAERTTTTAASDL